MFFYRSFFLLLALSVFFLLPAVWFFHPLFFAFCLAALLSALKALLWLPESFADQHAPLQRLPPEDPWGLSRLMEELKADLADKRGGKKNRFWPSRPAPVCLKASAEAPFSLCLAPVFGAPKIIISESLLDILSEQERKRLAAWHFQAAVSGGAVFLTLISRIMRFVYIVPLSLRLFSKSAAGRMFVSRLVFRAASVLARPVFLKLDQLAAAGHHGRETALLLWKACSLSQTQPPDLPLFFAPLSPVCLLAGARRKRRPASLHPKKKARIKALAGGWPPRCPPTEARSIKDSALDKNPAGG